MFFRETNKKLDEILGRLDRLPKRTDLINMEHRIMATLQEIIDDATEESTVIASVKNLLQSLSAQLAAAGTDPAKLQALKDLIDKNKADLAAAVVANTPAAP